MSSFSIEGMTYLQIGKIIIDLIFQYSSPHLHIILWLKDAPKFDGKNMAECINFIDRFISCNNDFKYSSLQKHKHTITCQKKKKMTVDSIFPTQFLIKH